ncbi:hypothetical protein, partial [Klebsiella variicola]|uniref:hypothetical protein n=1 Tax=Klebsiella variicola TaxID=244366 RepID=UPI0027547655|nr:hypothetical protein [Klebsiella variicola]
KTFAAPCSFKAFAACRPTCPGQAFVKVVQAELESLMGAANEDLNLSAVPAVPVAKVVHCCW